jgi:hypothetical protein
MPLQRSGKDYTIMKVLPSGVYQYRFIVDGQWRYSPDLPWAKDDAGNAHNTLDLQVIFSSLPFGISAELYSDSTKLKGRPVKISPSQLIYCVYMETVTSLLFSLNDN